MRPIVPPGAGPLTDRPAAPDDTLAAPTHPGAADDGARRLGGLRILLPRLRTPDALAEGLEHAGATVERAALTRTAPVPGQGGALENLCRRLVTGEAAWLVLTSARTVEVLAPCLLRQLAHHSPSGGHDRGLPQDVRVAVVGPATARSWRDLIGRSPDVVADGSAQALLHHPVLATGPSAPGGSAGGSHSPDGSLPGDSPGSITDTSRRVLLPASALASPVLAQGLRRAGWQVEQVEAYTTVPAPPEDLPSGLLPSWQGGRVDVVVLTAPSVTRALLHLVGPPPPPTRTVAIGATTAQAAREAGIIVDATAASPTPAGVLRAVEEALRRPVRADETAIHTADTAGDVRRRSSTGETTP
ncbi:uroporphyrinogen-III synthase [Actinomyces wuliandei]|uniref:uroporphyrinogen-III synthase n=1 Tax=Actinomyces wuliandei TaxID=2057743 RepID=UPI000FD8BFFA|nr:uroporphyrinogen-III synthase [Actinomyces wuliandei]